MKEAIKVQSDTITVINGMSGAWVRQKQARSLLRSWLTVKERAKKTVCVQEGRGSIALGLSGVCMKRWFPKSDCQRDTHPYQYMQDVSQDAIPLDRKA